MMITEHEQEFSAGVSQTSFKSEITIGKAVRV
jgi:hypothetical protein